MGNDSYRRTARGMAQGTQDDIIDLQRRLGAVPTRLSTTGAQVLDWDDVEANGYYWADTGATNAPAAGALIATASANPDGDTVVTATLVDGTRRWRRVGTGLWVELFDYVPDDTGWITPTLLNSFTPRSGVVPAYRRLNGVVHLRGQAYRATAPGTPGTIAFQLPAGFRPFDPHFVQTIPEDLSPNTCSIQAANNGDVSVYATTVRTSGSGYSFATSFIADF